MAYLFTTADFTFIKDKCELVADASDLSDWPTAGSVPTWLNVKSLITGKVIGFSLVSTERDEDMDIISWNYGTECNLPNVKMLRVFND